VKDDHEEKRIEELEKAVEDLEFTLADYITKNKHLVEKVKKLETINQLLHQENDELRIIKTDKEYYLNLRNKYHPKKLEIVFVLESPPVSGKYFYDETGDTSEPLFSAMMKLFGYIPSDKKDGLEFFKSKGYLIVDATYKQVNSLTGDERNTAILSDFNNLVDDLERICPKKEIPIILVKANICRLLEERLTAKGFNVINNGAIIPFPAYGHQNRFHSEMNNILSIVGD
jgi:hypothetical protein